MCKTIKQKVKFRAEPADVYGHLVSDADAIGAPFTLGEGTGIVVDLAPSMRVVRAWREPDYPEGVFSMAAVTLRPVATGTELTLTHRGVPKELIPRTEARWRRDHWDRLRDLLRQPSHASRQPPAVMAAPTPTARRRTSTTAPRRPSVAG